MESTYIHFKKKMHLLVALHFITEVLFLTYFVDCYFGYLSMLWLHYYSLHTFNFRSRNRNSFSLLDIQILFIYLFLLVITFY